jgi:mannose-6-phosphate isomerase-like protein (cupin superfamily)
MHHPSAIRPEAHAAFHPEKMGKATLFESERILVGLNCFEAGQEHALHAHDDMDKVYQVIAGMGLFLLEDRELPMESGLMLVAPSGVPHGIRNTGPGRLVVLAILAPAPGSRAGTGG